MNKANVAVAILAKNAERTIADCLDSIVPFVKQVVVCVEQLTTDHTAKIAKKHGAHVFRNFVVSEEHECSVHGKVLAQHFANARQASFQKLRADVDWFMWLDADDVVKGGEKIATFLEKLAPDVAGVWLPYHYATAGKGGPTTTLFDRERIVRANMPWQWRCRVHEILTPVGRSTESLHWVRTDEVAIYHQSEGHDTAGSARRNILLLEIDLEENSEDPRAWFYLGNQYFALGQWQEAIESYEHSIQSNNPYQLWQGLVYLSMACEKVGDLEQSRLAAFRALDVQPSHPEPYYRLAACYMLAGDVGRTEFWTRLGDSMVDPPAFVFRNPVDRPYNARLTLAQAYAMSGHTSKAKRQLEMAARVIPSKEVLEGITYHRQLEEDAQVADAYVRVLQNNGDLHIPENVWRFGRVRDIVIPRIISSRPSTQPRIIFFCGQSLEPWYPGTLNTTGIGGSETAVIQIAKRFAQAGWKVDVYNNCDYLEGIYDEVGYWDCKRLQENEATDVLVAWRQAAFLDIPISHSKSLLWCHDLNQGPDVREAMSRFDKVLGVSPWHAEYLEQVYGLANVGYVPNGIELERFTEKIDKIPFRCVYASSQDRGLLLLLSLWPAIVSAEPKAELHVAYGWENMDKAIAMGHQDLAQLKERILELLNKVPNVIWRGRIPQSDLARLYQESYCWLYPTQYLEVSCISAMEAMAGGCVPVTSAAGALPETIGDAGIIVTGNTYSRVWKDFWLQCAKAVLFAPDVRIPLMFKGLERARKLSWDNSFEEHWLPLVSGILEGSKNAVVIR